MKSTIIKLEEPYICEAIIEKIDGQPPYLAEVRQVLLPFEGKLMDVTLQVVCSDQLCKKLEDRVMKAYLESAGEEQQETAG